VPGKPQLATNQWLHISDFSAGCINYAETTSATAHRLNPAPIGAADPAETYSCIALPNGGLGALPELATSYAWPGLTSGTHTAYLVGLLVHDELASGNTEAIIISEFDDGTNHHWQAYSFLLQTLAATLIVESTETSAAGIFGSPYPQFSRANLTQFGTSGSPLTLTAGSYTITGTWTGVQVGGSIQVYEVISGAPTIPFDTEIISVVGSTLTMSNPIGGTTGTAIVGISDDETPGNPVIVFPSGGPAVASGQPGQVWMYPNPSNPTSYTPLALITGSGSTWSSGSGQVIAHQNRIIIFSGTVYPWPTSTFGTNEAINYTDPPNSTFLGFQGTVLQAEDPYGYGGASSVSAGELFVIKKRGGGVVLTGDINSPNVTFYPGVQPTGGMYGQAAAGTPGIFYCSYANGAWLWNGGNTAQKISMQLDDNFFLPEEFLGGMQSNNYGYFVQCIGDKAYFSNNWIYDMTLHSWWIYYPQSSQGGTNLFWVNPVSGPLIYAANLSFKGTGDFLYSFDTSTPAQTYQWQSLPLKLVAQNHVCDIREIIVTATCSDVNCSFEAYIISNGTLVWDETMTGDLTAGPQMIRLNTGLNAGGLGLIDPQIRIKVTNSSPGEMAIIHDIAILYDERAPVPANN
jgi:hypothetical protein